MQSRRVITLLAAGTLVGSAALAASACSTGNMPELPANPDDDRGGDPARGDSGAVDASGAKPGSADAGDKADTGTTPKDAGVNPPTKDGGGEPWALPGFTLTWHDEFDGASNSAPDPSKWKYDIGNGDNGWGNGELQYYTDRRENSAHDGQGHMVIKVLKDDMGKAYTSARLLTRDKFAQAYGRFEARMRVPQGSGLWPAFWMLGNDIGSVGWPRCGEIDIMENVGREPFHVHGTLHGPGYSGGDAIGVRYSLPNNAKYADDFHVFATEWDPNRISFMVDGKPFATQTPTTVGDRGDWVYDHPAFIILNTAVGGIFPGPPDGTARFPQTLTIDYVRVYKRN